MLHRTALVLAAANLVTVPTSPRDTTPEPAHIVRGHRTEERQREFKARFADYHDALEAALYHNSPDLLPRLIPAPVAVTPPGYQLLPNLSADTPPPAPPKPEIVRYSWNWSDKLLAREEATLADLERDLVLAAECPDPTSAYEALITSYHAALERGRPIDSDIDYNRFWQAEINAHRARYDQTTALMDATVAVGARTGPERTDLAKKLTAAAGGVSVHDYVDITEVAPCSWNFRVLLSTDIEDAMFVHKFKTAVEEIWQANDDDGTAYRVEIDIEIISPRDLYCREAAVPTCTPPARGAPIELAKHIARFPSGRAVLTTAGATLHFAASRAIVLTPHELPPRPLAHEVGHLLGLPDLYLRGYRDLGADGFEVTELVTDPGDLMSSPGAGSVHAGQFSMVLAARRVQTLMDAGLAALYVNNDPTTAAASFHEVLALHPGHYGATLQMAKALDRAGRSEEAIAAWRIMQELATAVGDPTTLEMVRGRLGSPP